MLPKLLLSAFCVWWCFQQSAAEQHSNPKHKLKTGWGTKKLDPKRIYAHSTYIAAVLEHSPSIESTPRKTLEKNLDLYRDYASQAREKSADIIVFPEYGLTTVIKDVEDYAIEIPDNTTGLPASSLDHIIQGLRSIAFERSLYMVVNLVEKAKSEKNKTVYYNTNVVFNRYGDIAAKYRKINLYDEDKITPGKDDGLVTFTTDFGVTFAVFTCFDIAFNNPSRTVLKNSNATDVVYPSAWFSFMPHFVSTSTQHGYAVANGVNLLAATYNNPKEGNGGSGIYLASGAIPENYISGNAGSKLIVRTVTKISKREERTRCTAPRMTPQGLPGIGKRPNISDFHTHKHFEHKEFTFKNVDLSKPENDLHVCNNKFCCTFNITVSNANTNEVYKVLAYDGWTKLGQDTKKEHIRVCSLVACKNSNDDSCGTRVNTTTKFTAINVRGTLPSDNTTYYQPVTLTYNLLPIQDSTYCTTPASDSDKVSVGLNLERFQDNLLVFGIIGRSSATTNLALSFLLFAATAFKLLF